MDIITVNRNEPSQIWRNVSEGAGEFISIELRQDGPNRDAIGSFIEVRTGERIQRREITVGGGHASGQLTPWHFGIGEATAADVRIQWPDGAVGDWQSVSAGSMSRFVPGREPEPVKP